MKVLLNYHDAFTSVCTEKILKYISINDMHEKLRSTIFQWIWPYFVIQCIASNVFNKEIYNLLMATSSKKLSNATKTILINFVYYNYKALLINETINLKEFCNNCNPIFFVVIWQQKQYSVCVNNAAGYALQ